jgi:hypothetical protein
VNIALDGILTDRIYYFIIGDGPSMPMFSPVFTLLPLTRFYY